MEKALSMGILPQSLPLTDLKLFLITFGSLLSASRRHPNPREKQRSYLETLKYKVGVTWAQKPQGL